MKKRTYFFPPNTLRRLMVKTLWLLIVKRDMVLRQLHRETLKKILRLVWQKEYMYVEDLLFSRDAQMPESVRSAPAVTSETDLPLPLVVCAVLGNGQSAALQTTLASIKAQTYVNLDTILFFPEINISDVEPVAREAGLTIYPLTAMNTVLLEQPAKYLGFIQAGDQWHAKAFERMHARSVENPLADLIYSDARIDQGAAGFLYKPDWSPELLMSMNYIGENYFVSRKAFAAVGGLQTDQTVAGMYDLALRITEYSKEIEHLADALVTEAESARTATALEREALLRACGRRGRQAAIVPLESGHAFRIQAMPAATPKVSIVLLTGNRNPKLLMQCVASVAKGGYAPLELVVVDNSRGALNQDKLAACWQDRETLRFIRYDEAFNYSLMNNLGAQKASGEYLVFLNDDTEVITSDWIETLLAYVRLPGVGVVGCHLLYPDHTTQHGGVFWLDDGSGIRHAFRHLRHAENSYGRLLEVTRECSAVTFACAMVPRRVFNELNGLDEQLKVEYNDIDFCLRASQAGYRSLWTPFAKLFHKELVSRQQTHFVDDQAYYLKRWKDRLQQGDPYFNPHLSLQSDFYLAK